MHAGVCTRVSKNRMGTAGFRIFFPFPVRSRTVNRVRFFIFYVSKSKNTKVIFCATISVLNSSTGFLNPGQGGGGVEVEGEDVAALGVGGMS